MRMTPKTGERAFELLVKRTRKIIEPHLSVYQRLEQGLGFHLTHFRFCRTTMKKGILQASAVAKVGDCVDVTKSDFKFDVKVSPSAYNVLTIAFP